MYCKLLSKPARSTNVREERKAVDLSNVESIFYRCTAALEETVICDYIVITVGHSLITLWLQCAKCLSTPFHVCCWFNLYFIYCKFKTILLYIKMMTKSITFVVYQFTSPHAMPHLLPRYHYSKLQMLNAKIFYVHYNCITQIPVLCHTVPQAIPQKPWPYAVTKNIIKHNVSSRCLWYTKLAGSISKENNFIAWNPNFLLVLRICV